MAKRRYKPSSKRGSTTSSVAPSQAHSASAGHGLKLIEVVERAWRGGFAVNARFVRDNRLELYVAAAASCGFISTKLPDGPCGRTWFVTQAGLAFLAEPATS